MHGTVCPNLVGTQLAAPAKGGPSLPACDGAEGDLGFAPARRGANQKNIASASASSGVSRWAPTLSVVRP